MTKTVTELAAKYDFQITSYTKEQVLANPEELTVTSLWPRMNKQSHIDEYKRELFSGAYQDTAAIMRVLTVSEEFYDDIAGDLLYDRPELFDKIGGSFNMKGMYIEWATATEEERKEWHGNSAIMVVKVQLKSSDASKFENRFKVPFLVNTEGYNYARYVGFAIDDLTGNWNR
jgi:hypothetical protein